MSMTTDQTPQPAPTPLSTNKRFLAAAGAAAVATTTVNPLDVIKTRLQAYAASLPAAVSRTAAVQSCHSTVAANAVLQACDHIKLQYDAIRSPNRFTSPTAAHQNPIYRVEGFLHHLNCAGGASHDLHTHTHFPLHSPSHHATQTPAWRHSCQRLSLACSSLGHPAVLSSEMQHIITAGVYTPAAAVAQPLSATSILRSMLRQEGVFVLWRGLDGALATSIPMVSIYMPLYDAMMSAYSPMLGSYSPVLCGVAARAVAVVAVAPLELTRTRQQAASAAAASAAVKGLGAGGTTIRPESAWATIRHFVTSTAAAGSKSAADVVASGVQRSVTTREVVRALPKLWTGVAATMARDLPFSAIYWGLAEPLRGALLPAMCAPPRPISTLPYHKTVPPTPTASAAAAHASVDPAPTPLTPTGSQVLWVNLIAGSVAGAVAAVATTPFDVIKTRLQIASPSGGAAAAAGCVGSSSSSRSGVGISGVAKDIWRTAGVKGLFLGGGLRAARSAPACAIVIAGYEMFKLALQ